MKRFIKSDPAAVLQAEADGLRAIAATRTIRVPEVKSLEGSELELEWFELTTPDAGFGERLGSALGELHRQTSSPRFGWAAHNFIGATPQVNTWHDDWLTFWREERLGAMLNHLHGQPELETAVRHLMESMDSLFDDGHVPRACLIHGDLWSGNWGVLPDGTPVIFDPCVSYSDAEAELAMMELFGSPPAGFFDAYREAAGLHEGYASRRSLYQLYHLLNHAVLFGGAYIRGALQCARGALATARRGP